MLNGLGKNMNDGCNLIMGKKYKIGYTSGVFDLFHIGHLNILKRAKQQCDWLIVGVTTDELCYRRKQKYPIINEVERYQIIEAIRYVDQVIYQTNMDKIDVIQKYGVDAVFVGSDWKGSACWQEYEKKFHILGCEVVYLEHTEGISSTILREKMMEK